MKINIISVGKLKEKYLTDAANEYEKRLGRFCSLNRIFIPDIKIPDNASPSVCDKILFDEGEAILKKIGRETVVALCIEGKMLDSVQMASLMQDTLRESSTITFVIGGSLGLSPHVKARADIMLSMSKMTFPHQIAQILLLEQIYRGFKINANEKYHK